MKRSVAIILIVVISVAAVALVAFVGKGAVTVIGQIGDIFGSGGEFPDLPSAPNSPDLPHESDTGLKFTETEPIETEPLLPPLNSGKLKFDGLALTILLPDTELYHREWGQKVAQNMLDDMISKRNEKILEELGLTVQYKFVPQGTDEYFELALNDVLGTEHNYDIALNDSSLMSRLAYRGAFENLLDKEQFPYFDFEGTQWNASVTKNLTVNGKLYFNTGAFSTTMLDNISAMFVNMKLYESYRADDDPEFLQECALEGKWTYEEMYRFITAFEGEKPGTLSLVIDNDLSNNDVIQSFATAFDTALMGDHGIVNNARAESVLTRMRELYLTAGVSSDYGMQKFVEGESFFLMTKMYKDRESNLSLREMGLDFGLMPLPKYDEEQKQYKAVSMGGSFIGIFDHSRSDKQTYALAVSAFAERMAEASHEEIFGYYFNDVQKPIYFGDDIYPMSPIIEIFDTMVNNIEFEFCNVYSSELGGIGDIWGDAYSNNKTLSQSYLDKQSEYEESLSKLDKFFGVSQ